MSSARGVFILVALAVLATGSSAQELNVQRIEQRVEAVRAAYRDAVRRGMQYDSLMRQPEYRVDVTEGPFHLTVDPEHAEVARRGAQAAVDSLRRSVGSARDLVPRLDALVSVIEQLRPIPTRPILFSFSDAPQVRPIYRVAIVPPHHDEREQVRWYTSSGGELGDRDDIQSEITARLLMMTYSALDRRAGSDFFNWVDQRSLRPLADQFAYRNVYRDVVVSPYRVGTQCFSGDHAACWLAFGLDRDEDWHDWYRGDDLRTLVRNSRVDLGALNREIRAVYGTCLQGNLQDCGTFMEAEYGDRNIDPPFGSATRSSLLQVAFAMGGADAYRRFLESDGSVAERISATAGSPLDALLDEWRQVLEGTAGKPVTTPWKTALLALTWTLVFAYFGLRSTPWR